MEGVNNMTKLHWVKWQNSDLLQDVKTQRNAAWVQSYPDLGYKVELWDKNAGKNGGDWVQIAMVPDLDTAKMIAKLNVHGELV
jgi:hypothetical protein